MAVYYDRNKAQEEGSALIPDMPGYTDWRDKPFANMRTEQDQIWWLYAHFTQLFDDTKLNSLDDRVTALEEQVNTNTEDIAEIRDDIAEIKRWLCNMVQSGIEYDVTSGRFKSSIAEGRHKWQVDHINAMSVDDLAQFTVAEADRMEIRTMIRDGRLAYMSDETPIGVIDQRGYECAFFNPDEYIKKSDLVVIDTDNLSKKDIMGVLTKDAGTDYPDWAPYSRPLTAHDLAHAHVKFDDTVVVPDSKE